MAAQRPAPVAGDFDAILERSASLRHASMAEWLLSGFPLGPAAEVAHQEAEEALACGSTSATSDATVRRAIDGCGTRGGKVAGTLGLPARSTANPPSKMQLACASLKPEPHHEQAAVQPLQQPSPSPTAGTSPADTAAPWSAEAAVCGDISSRASERSARQAVADSCLLSGSQASAAMRASGGHASGGAGAGTHAAAVLASSDSLRLLQGLLSSGKASDKGLDAGAGSGCGSGGGSGNMSGIGSEPPMSEQSSSMPSLPSSESDGPTLDGPALSGKDQERLKRRLANRESAQHVRQRRRLEFGTMQNKLASMAGDTQRLVARITAAEAARDATAQQLAALQGQLAAEHAARALLQQGGMLQQACAGLQQGGMLQVAPLSLPAGTSASVGTAAPQAPLLPAAASPPLSAPLAAPPSGPGILPLSAPPRAAGCPPPGPAALHPAVGAAPQASAASRGAGLGGNGGFSISLANAALRKYPALPGIGPLTTGMPQRPGAPPPSLHVRTQPQCCIVSSGWAPPAGRPASAAHPGANSTSATVAAALAPQPQLHSTRLRQRGRQGAGKASKPTLPAAAAAHARLAAHLRHNAAGQQPQSRPPVACLAAPFERGGGGAVAAASLMTPPSLPVAANAAAGDVLLFGAPATSPFAAYSLLPFED